MSRERLERHHPNLVADRYTIQSRITRRYNCFAWVVNDEDHWWQPFDPRCDIMDPIRNRFWPVKTPMFLTIDILIDALATRGFAVCESGEFEPSYEKIAVYAKTGSDIPTHAAKQLDTGIWASKMGDWEDIHHHTVNGLEDDRYGRVVRFLRKPR